MRTNTKKATSLSRLVRKMHRRHAFLTAALLVAATTLGVVEPRRIYNEQQKAALQNVFEQMLGIRPPPHLSSGTTSSSSSDTDTGSVSDDDRRHNGAGKMWAGFKVPKHMIELYERFMTTKRRIDETVRSIEPMKDPQILGSPINDMLFFNVSNFDDNEEVMNAQLHLRRRRSTRHAHVDRPKGQFLAPPSRVRIYKVIETQGKVKMIALASIPVPQTSRGGWHSLDISSPTRELLINSPKVSANLTLAIRFEAPRGRTIGPYDFLDTRDNKTSPIYLVVFSEDSHENLLSKHIPRRKIHIQPEHIDILKDLIKVTRPENQTTYNYKQRHQTHYVRNKESRRHKNKNWRDEVLTLESEDNGDINELISMGTNFDLRKNHRSRKYKTNSATYKKNQNDIDASRLSNEIVEDIDAEQERRSLQMNRRQQRSIEDNELPENEHRANKRKKRIGNVENNTKAYIPYPDGMKRKREKRMKDRKRRKQLMENTNGYLMDKESSQLNNTRHKSDCHLENYILHFEDIGWNEWILRPTKMDLNYCIGSCLTFNNSESNYAMVRQMVHLINKDIPQACCVPRTLGPLSILMLEKDTITFRSYKHISAQRCWCI